MVWLIILTAVNSQNQGMMQMMGFGRINQQGINNSNVIDAHFIEQMIPHHEDAITISNLALTKAARTEVKFDESKISFDKIIKIVKQTGYDAVSVSDN